MLVSDVCLYSKMLKKFESFDQVIVYWTCVIFIIEEGLDNGNESIDNAWSRETN